MNIGVVTEPGQRNRVKTNLSANLVRPRKRFVGGAECIDSFGIDSAVVGSHGVGSLGNPIQYVWG